MPTLNVDLLLRLADVIEQQEDTDWDAPSGFAMSNYEHSCGTPCCIAGWLTEIEGEFDNTHESTSAQGRLGITGDQCFRLFAPVHMHARKGDRDHITARHAAAVLRNLARTGKVDWRFSHKKGYGKLCYRKTRCTLTVSCS